MKRLVFSLLAISLVVTGTSYGSWKETFGGVGTNPSFTGYDRSDWVVGAQNGGAYTATSDGGFLRVTTSAYPAAGADRVSWTTTGGTVESDFTAGAWFNINPETGSQGYCDSSEAILFRVHNETYGNTTYQAGYGLNFNRGHGHFRLFKFGPTVGASGYKDFPVKVDINHFGLKNNEKVYAYLKAQGGTFTVTIFDQNLNFVTSFTDDGSNADPNLVVPFNPTTDSVGVGGFMTYLNPNVAPESPLKPYPSLMNSTIDDITSSNLAGDTDCNGIVNYNDFVTLKGNFGKKGTWLQGDFNMDGVVGYADFVSLKGNFGQTAPSPVPEPVTLAILALGGLFIRRK